MLQMLTYFKRKVPTTFHIGCFLTTIGSEQIGFIHDFGWANLRSLSNSTTLLIEGLLMGNVEVQTKATFKTFSISA